jgi:hypothetical protein
VNDLERMAAEADGMPLWSLHQVPFTVPFALLGAAVGIGSRWIWLRRVSQLSPRAKYCLVFLLVGPAIGGAILFAAARFWIYLGIALAPFSVWIQMMLMRIRCPQCDTSIGFPRGFILSLDPFFPKRECGTCGADLDAKLPSRQ